MSQMTPQAAVATFFAAVAALVVGWLGGAAIHDAVGGGYDVAVGVVDTAAGVPVISPTPTPEPTTAPPTESATPTPTTEPTESPTPFPTETPTPSPAVTPFPTFP
jgi:hypothetical protein